VLLARFHELQKLTGAFFCQSFFPQLLPLAAPFLNEEGKTEDELDVKRSVFVMEMTID
jgi:hypothetical protein